MVVETLCVSPQRAMYESPLSYAMLSDPGRVRQRNEDACAADLEQDAFVVCDGVGGAAGGEIASQLAASTFLAHLKAAHAAGTASDPDPAGLLRDGVEAANHAVYSQSQDRAQLAGMATTLVAMLFAPDPTQQSAGTMWLSNVGDSRCYRLRDGILEQLTDDHSLVGEQVRNGLMTREEAEVSPIRNVITRAVGSESAVEPDIQNLAVHHGDLFLLSSDGLTRELSDADVAQVLVAMAGAPDQEIDVAPVCAELVRRANEKGGGDNITCLLVKIR